MKRIVWYLKIAVLCAALFVLSGGGATGVGAQDEEMVIETGGACETTAGCKQSSSNQCFCESNHGNCNGCYVPNGGTGCGTCDKN